MQEGLFEVNDVAKTWKKINCEKNRQTMDACFSLRTAFRFSKAIFTDTAIIIVKVKYPVKSINPQRPQRSTPSWHSGVAYRGVATGV